VINTHALAMPEPTANLLVRLCFHNQGRLSMTKRGHMAFEKLTDEEIDRLEAAVAAAYAGTDAVPSPQEHLNELARILCI
jgi:hypothetical protein